MNSRIPLNILGLEVENPLTYMFLLVGVGGSWSTSHIGPPPSPTSIHHSVDRPTSC